MSKPSSIHDTRPEAEQVLIDLIRNRPAHVRLADAIDSSNRVAQQCKNAIRRANPEISDDELGLRFVELNYGSEKANELRAWLARTTDEQ